MTGITGIYDNSKTNRRERWFNGELKYSAERNVDGSVLDYVNAFGRPSHEWGYFPDVPDDSDASTKED